MPKEHQRFYVTDAAGTTFPPVSSSSSSATSPPSSTTDPAWETPPLDFETSPRSESRPTPRHGGASKGKRRSKHRRQHRHMSDANQSTTRHRSPSLMKDNSSSGRGPSRRWTATQNTNTQDRMREPVRNDASNGFVHQSYDSYIPSQAPYGYGPQMVPYAGNNYFGPQSYAMPTPMPPHVPAPSHPQPAAPPPQTTSPEAEELRKLKEVFEEELSKRKAEEERRKQDALEQKLKREANEAALKNVEDMKHVEEKARKKAEEAEQRAYSAALEAVEADKQRRRTAEEEFEQCRRIADAKIRAEVLLEAEKKRRAEEQSARIRREAEAKVAREMDERRRLRQEEEERMARMRQQIEDQIRAEMLEEQATHLSSSRKSGSLSSRSSKHGGRSSSSTTRSSRLASRLLQNPDEEAPVVLNHDIPQGFPHDPFFYFEGQSTAPPSLADEEPATKEPCCKCGQYAKDQSSGPLKSRIREQGFSYGDLDTGSAQGGRPRFRLLASHSKAGSSEVSNIESSGDEGSGTSTISAASDLVRSQNPDIVHWKTPGAANPDNDVYPRTTSQPNLRNNITSISTIKTRKHSVEAGKEPGSDHIPEAAGELLGDIESREPGTPSFSVFQYLVTEETSEEDDDDDDDEHSWEDYDSADGGATITSHNRQEANNSLNTLTEDEAERSLVATQQHQPADTTQAQGPPSQESRLLLVLAKHIKDSEQASQHNRSVNIGSPSQDWRKEERARNCATPYPGTFGYVPDCFNGVMPYSILPNSIMGGQRKWPSGGFQISQVTEEPALEPSSSPLTTEYKPMVPMALVPCIILPISVVQSVERVPMLDNNENAARPGQSSGRHSTCDKGGHDALIRTTL